MSEIRFKHQTNSKKTWLVPLIVIALLYITIPVLLINKGSDSFNKASIEIEQDINKAANYYNSGYIFTDLAENFPGFSTWANNTAKKGKNQISNIISAKCKEIQNKSIDEQNKFCEDLKIFTQKTKIKLAECETVCK